MCSVADGACRSVIQARSCRRLWVRSQSQPRCIGHATRAALAIAEPIRRPEREAMTAKDLARAGSSQVRSGGEMKTIGTMLALAGSGTAINAVDGAPAPVTATVPASVEMLQGSLAWVPGFHQFLMPVMEGFRFFTSNLIPILLLIVGVWFWIKADTSLRHGSKIACTWGMTMMTFLAGALWVADRTWVQTGLSAGSPGPDALVRWSQTLEARRDELRRRGRKRASSARASQKWRPTLGTTLPRPRLERGKRRRRHPLLEVRTMRRVLKWNWNPIALRLRIALALTLSAACLTACANWQQAVDDLKAQEVQITAAEVRARELPECRRKIQACLDKNACASASRTTSPRRAEPPMVSFSNRRR